MPSKNSKLRRKNTQSNQTFRFETLESKRLLALTAGSSWPVFDPATNWTSTDAAQEQLIRSNLAASKDTAYLQAGTSDLRLIEIKHGLASTTTRFQQTIDGLPVFGAFVTVNQGPGGEIQEVYNQGYDQIATREMVGPDVSGNYAEQQAMLMSGATQMFADTRVEMVWYPSQDGRSAEKVWQLTVYGSDPTGEFLTVVSTNTGKVIRQENRIEQATGLVYDPNPYQTLGAGTNLVDSNDATNATLDSGRVNVTLQGLNGSGYLVGEYVDLRNLNSTTIADVDAFEPTGVYNYNRDDYRFEQVVVYHSVDQINRYFHALGFDDANPTPNGIRDFPTLANAHWYTADNSFYSTGDDAIHFGDGGVDDAEDADVVAHEYGHAVQHDQNAAWGGGEMGAMGEGFGDYLAASFYASYGDPTFQSANAAAVAEWDATSYSSASPPNLRRVDGTKMYPEDLTGEVHDDGEIWSAALWEIRTHLGGPVTDTLVLESHFGLPGGATMEVAANRILLMDQNINGGANAAVIRQAFINRGILEAPPESGVVTLNKSFYRVNDTIAISVLDANAVEPLSVTISSSSGDSETVTLSFSGPNTYAGMITSAPGANAVDGVLQVGLGDTITVTYNDPNDGNGIPTTSVDMASVANIYASTDTPLSIADNTTFTSTISITDLGVVDDVNVQVNITHTYDADLDVFLIAPDNTRVELFTDVGGSGDNFVDTILDDSATTAVTAGSAPFTGSYRPEGSLAALIGKSITGNWKLEITDDAGGDVGALNGWGLFIESSSVDLGRLELDQTTYFVGDVIGVSLQDENVTAPISVTVTEDNGDSEVFQLTDLGLGQFGLSIPTIGGTVTAGDGILQVSVGTQLTVEYVDLDNGAGSSESVSAVAAIVVNPAHQGQLMLDKASYNVGDMVDMLVTDANAVAPISVMVTSNSGDSEVFTLTDLGGGQFGLAVPTAAGIPVTNDGTLQAAIGTVFTFKYLDADDGTGSSNLVTRVAGIQNVIEYVSTDIPVAITDNATFTSEIVITDLGSIADLNVKLNVSHTWDADLDVFLIAPDGTSIELFQDVGGSGDNFTNTILDDEAATAIGAGAAPFNGAFTPVGSLAALDGMSITGTWTLSISDDAGGDTGTLNSWSLIIDVIPVALPEVSIADAGVITEDDSGSQFVSFVVSLSEPVTQAVSIDFATTTVGYLYAATAGQDFAAASGTLNFAVGEQSKTIMVEVFGDVYMENNERFGVELSNPVGVSLVDSLGDATIVDNETYLPRKRLDFGPFGSDVPIGHLGVNDLIYTADRGMGWTTPPTQFVDSGIGNAFTRDYALITDSTFNMDVGRGIYSVTIGLGSAVTAHDNVRIWVEGRIVDTVTTAAGQFYSKAFAARGSDGTLNIRIEDLGGASNEAALDFIQVQPKRPFVVGKIETGLSFPSVANQTPATTTIEVTRPEISETTTSNASIAARPMTTSAFSKINLERSTSDDSMKAIKEEFVLVSVLNEIVKELDF